MKKAVFFAVLAFAVVAGVVGWQYLAEQARQREELRKLQQVVDRLNAERRVAQVVVKERSADASGKTVTKLDFLEWDREKRPLPPVHAELSGNEVYFEALVIKFRNDYVERGDPLRGASIILFRRMFGSKEAPDSGVPIDPGALDGIPSVYRVDKEPSSFEIGLWKRFWYYADHPEEARPLGVRVLQCEAVGGRLQPNCIYELTVEADGGLNLVPTTPLPDE
jgi:hypothetical protein